MEGFNENFPSNVFKQILKTKKKQKSSSRIPTEQSPMKKSLTLSPTSSSKNRNKIFFFSLPQKTHKKVNLFSLKSENGNGSKSQNS